MAFCLFYSGGVPCSTSVFASVQLQKNVEELKGKSLKQYEDILDAFLCAYLALFYWRWGEEKNEMIGDLKSGYIINPTEPL
jgi:predicted RNase H-like nuclease